MKILSRAPLIARPLLYSTRRQFHAIRPLRSDASAEPKPPPPPKHARLPTLIYPEPPSSEHRDLGSFLEYAERISLNKSSTVYVGTRYEYTAALALTSFGFSLKRIGRAGDCGIDLLGTWTVPTTPQPLRVMLQCKATLKSTPSWVRELEGAFAGAPPGWRGSGVLGFLVTDKPATPGIRKALANSLCPMGYVFCTRVGGVQQILWNYKSEEQGLTGLGVSKRYNLPKGEETMAHKVVLTCQGKQIPLIE